MSEETHSNHPPAAPLDQRVIAAVIDGLLAMSFTVFLGRHLGFPVAVVLMLLRDAFPFLDGQSVGKKVMMLQALDADTLEPLTGNWKASAIRNIPCVIPFFQFVELIYLLKNGQDQRMGDEWANTRVVKLGEKSPEYT